MDVANVDPDVAHVAMAIHVCCKRLFEMFYLFVRRMLQVFLSGYCICFTQMLHAFVLNVSSILDVCCSKFLLLLQVFSCFKR